MRLNLLKARIVNYQTYRGEHVLDLMLPPGLYFVGGVNRQYPDMGPNGVGKSTLFGAILWCLYGVALRSDRPGGLVEPWTGEREVRVETDIELGGAWWRIARTRNPNALQLMESRDKGKHWTEPKDATQGVIDDLLGLSRDTFRYTIMLLQFGDLFLDLKPEGQSELFNTVLNLDLWLRASDAGSTLATAVQKELEAHRGTLAQLDGRLSALRGSLASESPKIQEFNVNKAALLAAASARLAELRKGAARGNNPVLGVKSAESAVRGLETDLAALRSSLSTAAGTWANALSRLKTSDSEVERLDKVILLYARPLKKCPECGQSVDADHIASKLADAKAAKARAVEVFVEADAQHDAATEKLNALREQVDAAQKKLAPAQAVSRQAVIDQTRADEAKGRIADAERDIERVKATANPHVASVTRLKQEIKDTAADVAKAKDAAAETESALKAYSYWAATFKEIRLDIVDSVLRELSVMTSQHADELGLHGWRIEFVTEKETASGKVSRKFSNLLYPPRQATPIAWEAYCGGEVQRWQLSARFGLSEMLLSRAGIQPSLEILDEPTAHLSPEGVGDLLRHLKERARDLNRQIWLIDHHALDRGAFDGVLMVTRDRQGSRFEMTGTA